MKKKLPNIYKGMVKNTNQNQKQSFISHEREESTYENEENLEKNFLHKNVNRQIKDIFSSPNFVYKANVSIKLVDLYVLLAVKIVIKLINNLKIKVLNVSLIIISPVFSIVYL